jgi:hypothetical protein
MFPRPREIWNQLHSHRIGNEHEYDWDPCRGVPQVWRCRCAPHQDIDIQCDKLGGHPLEACRSFVRETMLQLDVSSFDVAQLGETVDHRFKVGMLLFGAGGVPEIAHYRSFAVGLRLNDAANCNRRAAGEEQKITPSHNGRYFPASCRTWPTHRAIYVRNRIV